MTINAPLLKQVMEQIESHPETWDQEVWRSSCGTRFCFAGWAAVLDGREWVTDFRVRAKPDDPEWVRSDARPGTAYVNLAAQYALGLDKWDAEELFYYGNTVDDLREYVAELTAQAEKETA